jgi:hypothetical protein
MIETCDNLFEKPFFIFTSMILDLNHLTLDYLRVFKIIFHHLPGTSPFNYTNLTNEFIKNFTGFDENLIEEAISYFVQMGELRLEFVDGERFIYR